jgi:signal transduction histidine kinase
MVFTPPPLHAEAGHDDRRAESIEVPQRRLDCELRNDLNVIIGFAALLAESDRLEEPLRRYAAHIASSGSRACASLRSLLSGDPAVLPCDPRGARLGGTASS